MTGLKALLLWGQANREGNGCFQGPGAIPHGGLARMGRNRGSKFSAMSRYGPKAQNAPPLNGFTLIELLAVIAIISLLVSILLPSLKKARDFAKTAVCLSQMKQQGLAIPMYRMDNDDRWPPLITVNDGGLWWVSNGTSIVGFKICWMDVLLPYLGEAPGVFDAPAADFDPAKEWSAWPPRDTSLPAGYGYNYRLDQSAAKDTKRCLSELPQVVCALEEYQVYPYWEGANIWRMDNLKFPHHVTGQMADFGGGHLQREGKGNILFADSHAEPRSIYDPIWLTPADYYP